MIDLTFQKENRQPTNLRKALLQKLALQWTTQALKDKDSQLQSASKKITLLQKLNKDLQDRIRMLAEDKAVLERELVFCKGQFEKTKFHVPVSNRTYDSYQPKLQEKDRIIADLKQQLFNIKEQLNSPTLKPQSQDPSLNLQMQQRLRQTQVQTTIRRLRIQHAKQLQLLQLQIAKLREENNSLTQQLASIPEPPQNKFQHFRKVIKELEDSLQEMFQSKKKLVAKYNQLKGQYIELKSLADSQSFTASWMGQSTNSNAVGKIVSSHRRRGMSFSCKPEPSLNL